MQVYCTINHNDSHSHTPTNLFVTQWQDNPSLAKFDWRTQYNYLEFNATSFTQKQYVLQAALTGQGRGLLSNLLQVQQ
ncbi:hypothetical protein [Pseudoalteromonas aurantia]|uniref:Uncharacterized protein n=1 Tax=Pseudoalteromonas aurantia 208 TaxID=1314867 RepID=A0ABR9EHT8_9GAMM|nr:hypothetical protein [Pseudoalteromonas aurantia]MBE0370555.1 hypothetical protein [Pseudoalteromonas aurantia 208]